MEKEKLICNKQLRISEKSESTLIQLSEEFGVSQSKFISDLIAEKTKLVNFVNFIRDHLSKGDKILINTIHKEFAGTHMIMTDKKGMFGGNVVEYFPVYKNYTWQLTRDFENFYLTKHTMITFHKIMSDEIVDVKQISTSPFVVNGFKDLYYHFLNVNIENLNIKVTPTK